MIDAYFTLFVTTHGDTCLFMYVYVCLGGFLAGLYIGDYYEHTFERL